MIIFMCDVICVTNRKLCKGDFLQRMEAIVRSKPRAVILREKDLAPKEYEALAKQVMRLCEEQGIPCILHTFISTAIALGGDAIHLPLPLLRTMTEEEKSHFIRIGASCHTPMEAVEAENLGCTYVTAGHIFQTDCKKGIPPRGLDFLQEVCSAVSIPVYAIGGICPENLPLVKRAGAAGGCVMSTLMECEQAGEAMKEFEENHTTE